MPMLDGIEGGGLMASGVIFKDNSKQVLAQMERNISQALHRVGIKWLERVSPLVPVDTSRLQKSMTYQVDIANKQVTVGTDVEYSVFVELGTYKMRAQPYLKPSIVNYINDYKSEVQKALGEGWGVSVNLGGISY